MYKKVSVRKATSIDAPAISTILTEATSWLKERNQPLWSVEMFTIPKVMKDLTEYYYYVAEDDGVVVGSFRFQLEDPEIWPEISRDDSAFLHRLVVRRSQAGRGVARQMILYAQQLTQNANRRFLRLDCAADRPKLRSIYENSGFVWLDDGMFGPYLISRYEWRNNG